MAKCGQATVVALRKRRARIAQLNQSLLLRGAEMMLAFDYDLWLSLRHTQDAEIKLRNALVVMPAPATGACFRSYRNLQSQKRKAAETRQREILERQLLSDGDPLMAERPGSWLYVQQPPPRRKISEFFRSLSRVLVELTTRRGLRTEPKAGKEGAAQALPPDTLANSD